MPLLNRPQFARSRRKSEKWKAGYQPATGPGSICRDMPLKFSLISGSGPIYHVLGCMPGPSILGAPSSGTHHHLSTIHRVYRLAFKRVAWILIQEKMDPNSCNDYKWMVTHWITKTGFGAILNFPNGLFCFLQLGLLALILAPIHVFYFIFFFH